MTGLNVATGVALTVSLVLFVGRSVDLVVSLVDLVCVGSVRLPDCLGSSRVGFVGLLPEGSFVTFEPAVSFPEPFPAFENSDPSSVSVGSLEKTETPAELPEVSVICEFILINPIVKRMPAKATTRTITIIIVTF